MSQLMRLDGLTIRFNQNTPPVLSGVTLSIGPGECHCITGPTGSGKSTLLRAVAGLLPPDTISGVFESDTQSGIVFQNPQTQILSDYVGKETAFALENCGTEPKVMPALVERALEEADLNLPLHTPTAILSMGRQYRLILASALVTSPSLLLLDEPCAQLDPKGCAAVAAIIDRVTARGGSVLLCEHDPSPLMERITHWWNIEEAKVVPSTPLELAMPHRTHAAQAETGNESLLNIDSLDLVLGAKTIFHQLSLTLNSGEAVHIEGPNGAGKSTLTRVLSGFLAPDNGSVTLLGKPVKPAALRGEVGLALQSPLSQLFEDTVRQELAYAAKRKGLKDATKRAEAMAEALGIAHHLDRAPHLLSYGTQRLVALGACLTQAPRLLILDDPFAGLDRISRDRIRQLLEQERKERGLAVVITGHNPPSPLRFADFYTRELRLEGGRLAAVA